MEFVNRFLVNKKTFTGFVFTRVDILYLEYGAVLPALSLANVSLDSPELTEGSKGIFFLEFGAVLSLSKGIFPLEFSLDWPVSWFAAW